MALTDESAIIIQNKKSGLLNQTITVLGYCNATTSTTTYTNSGIVIDAIDASDGADGVVVLYFLSSNVAATTLTALAAAESVSGNYTDTSSTTTLTFTSIDAGSFSYNSTTYAYKMTSSAVTDGNYADMDAGDLLTLNLAAVNITDTAVEVAEQYVDQLVTTGYSTEAYCQYTSYTYQVQDLSTLNQLTPE